jgi:uncharacterized protein YjiS (DUF1127 family)
MATIYTQAAPFGAIAIHQAVTTLSDAFAALRSWNDTRRTVAALRALKADQLDDIGLTPADVNALGNRGF